MTPFLHAAARCRWALPALVALGFAFSLACEFFPIFNDYTKVVLMTIGINIILCASLNLVNLSLIHI